MDHKEILHQGLRRQRDALFAKLDGLPEREVRLPRTPTGKVARRRLALS